MLGKPLVQTYTAYLVLDPGVVRAVCEGTADDPLAAKVCYTV